MTPEKILKYFLLFAATFVYGLVAWFIYPQVTALTPPWSKNFDIWFGLIIGLPYLMSLIVIIFSHINFGSETLAEYGTRYKKSISGRIYATLFAVFILGGIPYALWVSGRGMWGSFYDFVYQVAGSYLFFGSLILIFSWFPSLPKGDKEEELRIEKEKQYEANLTGLQKIEKNSRLIYALFYLVGVMLMIFFSNSSVSQMIYYLVLGGIGLYLLGRLTIMIIDWIENKSSKSWKDIVAEVIITLIMLAVFYAISMHNIR